MEYTTAMAEAEAEYPAALALAEVEVEYSVAMADVAMVKAEVDYPTAMAEIFSHERRFLVDGGGADDADDCADDKAAGKGEGNGDGLLPFSVTIDMGEYIPPSSVSVSDSVSTLGTPSATPNGNRATRGGSPDAQASVYVLPSGSAGPSPPYAMKALLADFRSDVIAFEAIQRKMST